MNDYKTVLKRSRAEYIEKRSRFIGTIIPVSNETDALEFIKEIKKEFWDATHNVYAYVLKDQMIQRYSDDKEPKGTAGMPVLEVLLKEGLTNCAVVITRYFGGVLLGAGGLVRAYTHGAKIAVDSSGIVVMKPCRACKIVCEYSHYERLNNIIQNHEGIIDNVEYGANIKISFLLRDDILEIFKRELADTFNGELILTVEGYNFAPF